MIRAKTGTSVRPGAKKNTGNGAAAKSGLVILLLVIMLIAYYYYLSNREQESELPVAKQTVAQELIARDLDNNYPPTPKEVLKYYSELTKCFYNEEYSEEELELLAAQARMLYDGDLASENSWGQYLMQLQEDIESFKGQSIRVSSYSLPASTDVFTFSEDGFDFARIYCTYVLSSGNFKQSVEEVFLLRKDEDKHWKIFGWDLAENVNIPE